MLIWKLDLNLAASRKIGLIVENNDNIVLPVPLLVPVLFVLLLVDVVGVGDGVLRVGDGVVGGGLVVGAVLSKQNNYNMF